MVFYAYVDPHIITIANNEGDYAIQSFIAILRGFLQNCFLSVFEDYRTQHAIWSNVNNITDVQSRKAIQSLFKKIKKSDRYIYCLIPDYTGRKKDVDCVVEQASRELLDILVLAEKSDIKESSEYEIATLKTYQFTNFELKRSNLVKNGKIWQEGDLDEIKFLDINFKKALRFAEEIIICDMILGKKCFPENYHYTISKMFRWLGQSLPYPFNLRKLIVHCEKPAGKGIEHVKGRFEKLKHGRLSNLEIEIDFYQKVEDRNTLPHDRFILTSQVAFAVGRGMDFLCKETETNRDVTISYLETQELHKFLNSYNRNLVDTVQV